MLDEDAEVVDIFEDGTRSSASSWYTFGEALPSYVMCGGASVYMGLASKPVVWGKLKPSGLYWASIGGEA